MAVVGSIEKQLRETMTLEGLKGLLQYVPEDTQKAIRDAIEPRDTRRHTAWKRSMSYQRAMLRSQLDLGSDNGSRRSVYLSAYCKPIQSILARSGIRILQPRCGRWLDFLKLEKNQWFEGFDNYALLMNEARRRLGGRPGRIRLADMLSFPACQPVDLVLLDYEFLNAFNVAEAASILSWAYDILNPGGVVFGDYRPKGEAKPIRSRTYLRYISKKNTLVWAEKGSIGNLFFGSQALVINTGSLLVRHQCQDIIRLFSQADHNLLFGNRDWNMKKSKLGS